MTKTPSFRATSQKGAMTLKPCVRHVVITQNLALIEDQGIWLVGS